MQSIFEKNNKDYTNAKIYQVLNNINNKVYVGGTCQILRKRMDVHRHYSVNRDGLIYEEMRRVGQKHFYIELIENYQCNNKEELILKLNSYIRERGTLNDRINTHVVEQIDVKPVILELKKMVLDMHIQLNNIEYKINTLLNTSYTSEASTSYDGDNEANEVSSNSKTSSTPEVFIITDTDNVEEIMPYNILSYDITEKHFNILKNKLPTKLYEGLEKQAVILSNAENQQQQHPNDKDRDFFNELAYQKLKDDIDEAGYRYQDDEKFDILNNKIPDNILKELKTASINFDKLAISVIDAPSLKDEDLEVSAVQYYKELLELYKSTLKIKQDKIEEAFLYYVLNKNKNPNDETNIECDKHFNIWRDIAKPKKKNPHKHKKRKG